MGPHDLVLVLLVIRQTSPDIPLPQPRQRANMLVLQSQVILGFSLLLLEGFALALDNPKPIHLLSSLFGETVHLH